MTKPVVMLGDSQEHESTGIPLHDNDSTIDAYVEVAQRPAEQPLFGRRILEWVLHAHPEDPFIHLGDLMDVSCRSEAQRLRGILSAPKQPGAVLPGNHDGLMFGIFNYNFADVVTDPEGAKWDHACRRAARFDSDDAPVAGQGGAYTKKDFITGYLSGIAAKLPEQAAALHLPAEGGDQRLSWRNAKPDGFIEAVEVELTPIHRYARSFLAQKLRLPRAEAGSRRVTILALDTNQIDMIVGGLDAMRGVSPGDIGHLQTNQIEVIAAWAEAAHNAGELVVFAGHHDWASLGEISRYRLGEIMRRLDHPLVYISAHTHSGFWALHEVAGRRLLELNVSSLSDWPIAYRRVSFQFDEGANRIKVVGELLPRTTRSARDDLELLHAWEELTCTQAGVPLTVIQQRDMTLVKAQRDGRGTLFDWIYLWLGGDGCEECTANLYLHAHGYLDLMLTAIKNTSIDLGQEVPAIQNITLPGMCSGQSLAGCVDTLKAGKHDRLQDSIALFRRKADLVDRANAVLDKVGSPRAKAYMTCRAIQAAKDDFDMTPVSSIAWRTEAIRRAGDFFRIEATVDMEPTGRGASQGVAPVRPIRGGSVLP